MASCCLSPLEVLDTHPLLSESMVYVKSDVSPSRVVSILITRDCRANWWLDLLGMRLLVTVVGW
jgi:hypothetical protein